MTMWFLKWWFHAISGRTNPFFTDLVWAPRGLNLAWTTFVPLPALVSIPFEVTLGEPASYNILVTLALPLAAYSAFLLCRRVTQGFWPSVLGGYLFGFSPYMLDEALRHLNLIAVFPVPLIVALALKRLDGGISGRRFAAFLAALLVAQFLCSIELFATATMIGAASLMLATLIFGSTLRARLASLTVSVIFAYLIAAALLTPYLYWLFAFGFPHGPIWLVSRYSADLIGLIIPRETSWLSTIGPLRTISSRLEGVFLSRATTWAWSPSSSSRSSAVGIGGTHRESS